MEKVKKMLTPRPSCFCCKRPLEIYRDEDLSKYIYFDKRLYHKECFVEENIIRKKCYFCKKDIEVQEDKDETVLYEKHFYHKECFIEWSKATKRPSKKRMFALGHIEIYMSDASEKLKTILKEKKQVLENIGFYSNEAERYINQRFTESEFCQFLRDTYNTKDIQWIRIKNIISGKTEKCDYKIPIEDIYDMWKRKMNFLIKQNNRLIKKSTSEITMSNLILYDLSILVNKYDSYCKWKEQQKLIESNNQKENSNTDTILTQAISNISNHFENKEASMNINDEIVDIIDDIFG